MVHSLVLLILAAFTVLPALAQQPLFTRIPKQKSGVENPFLYTPDDHFKAMVEMRTNPMVPGNGVGIGDFNGDSLPDMVLSSVGGIGVYYSTGNFHFDRVTDSVLPKGVDTKVSTGISVVDIDGDGDLDFYVCRTMLPNLLFVNDGKGHFTELAGAYGLDLALESVQATFFDADNDGDLDCWVSTYSRYTAIANRPIDKNAAIEAERAQREQRHMQRFLPADDSTAKFNMSINRNRLQHDGETDFYFKNMGNGSFVNYTYEAWIDDQGMSLSATAADINLDGWPDMYVANDFYRGDIMHMNNRDGSFAPMQGKLLNRMSVFSMGSDIADFNNDGYPDIVTTDMLPRTHHRRISNTGNNGDASIYNPTYDSNQVSRNMLQLNHGNGQFSDIGYMTDVAATDWSWAVLFADYDLDGKKDLIIANGYPTDVSNQDYVYNNGILSDTTGATVKKNTYLREPTNAFLNDGDLQFKEVSTTWGLADTSASLGAAYVDIDRDGDLDFVLGNIDQEPFIYRNMAREQGRGNSIVLRFDGKAPNTQGIGAKVRVVVNGKPQYYEHYVVRGFQSTVGSDIIVGLGAAETADSVIVQWQSGTSQVFTGVAANNAYTLHETDAKPTMQPWFGLPAMDNTVFVENTTQSTFDVRYDENTFDDFKRYRLAPVRESWGGPCIAVGDIDGDKIDDVIMGGALGKSAVVFKQSVGGTFQRLRSAALEQDAAYEDQAMLLIDVDGDGDKDLVVAGGGAEVAMGDSLQGMRLYINNGKGVLKAEHDRLAGIKTNATTMCAADIDLDGDLDLFIGGGIVTDTYPIAASSFLLQNDGKGRFTDVTDKKAPGLRRVGHVRSALFTDATNDGRPDLMVTGEWMPISLWENTGAAFTDITQKAGLDTTHGWWYSINGGDVDNDGDIDYVVGNMGLNNRYQFASKEKPIEVYAADFDENESIDALITYQPIDDGKKRMVRDRMTIFGQMPTLNRKFPKYVDFASTTLDMVASKEQLDTAFHGVATMMSSVVLVNNGNGTFTTRPLPRMAQISPIMGSQFADLNGDQYLDLVVTGNMFGAEGDVVRYDAGRGLVLYGNGDGTFRPVMVPESGFFVRADMRGLAVVTGKDATGKPIETYIAAVNQGIARTFIRRTQGSGMMQPVDGKKLTSVILQDGMAAGRKAEIYCGNGYRSQSSSAIPVPQPGQGLHQFFGQKRISSGPVTKTN